MNKIKGCLFDLDGVIVDTAKYHYLAWKRLANELGFDFTEEDNERLKGVSRMKSLDILLEIGNIDLDNETKAKYAEKKNNWYKEYISKMDSSEILPGVIDFLKSLKNNNICIGLGSASKNAMTILKVLDITNYFDVIIDGNKVINAKPDPEVFLLGAKELGIHPRECVVFEDAYAGIEAAKRANMIAIGIGNENTLNNADKVIKGLHDIRVEELDNLR